MFKYMLTNGAGRIALFALVLLAPCSFNSALGQALNMDGQSGNFSQPSADAVPSHQNGLGAPMTPDVDEAHNGIADPIHDNGPVKEETAPPSANAAVTWGPVPTKKASVANLAPVFLPFLNNGPVFGLPGTDAGDFRNRTQLTGDWGGLRTDLARHGFFLDLYSTSAYQDVVSGGLKTGNTSIQNAQLSINVDTGRAGLWPGGVVHISLESRYGSSSPQNTFTVGSTVPQYTGLAFPGPFFVHDVLPTEYFLLQSLTPKFAVILGKANVLTHADQTLFSNSYKYYFANLNFTRIRWP